MRRIQTIIFDISGVLINDLYAVWKADSDAYEACGLGKIETLEKFRSSFRLPIFEYHKSMCAPDSLIPELEDEYRRAYPKYSGLVTIFPEVKTALAKLKQEKLVLAVASNMPCLFLEEHLRRFGINTCFDTVTGQEDCPAQKPSPQPILVTLEKLGSRPEQSAYVGDMEEDIIAGKGARVCTFAICRDDSYHPAWKLRRQNPDFLIHDLDELLAIVRKMDSANQDVSHPSSPKRRL